MSRDRPYITRQLIDSSPKSLGYFHPIGSHPLEDQHSLIWSTQVGASGTNIRRGRKSGGGIEQSEDKGFLRRIMCEG